MNTKKLIFATLSALSVASLFADDFRFTETAGQFGKYNTNPKQYITGYYLTGTDGASLFVNGATGYLPDTVKEGFITLVNGNIDGTVYFLENIVTSDGFADGTITITHASKSQMISFIDSDGNKMGDDRLKFGKTEIDGKNYYFATTIPEPAEWAAIFGAIAGGLAVCRRRK